MSNLDDTLWAMKPPIKPTLKDHIREHLPAMEEWRANKVPWNVILHTLQTAGLSIDPQLLANYVCQIRKERRAGVSANLEAQKAPSVRSPKIQGQLTKGRRGDDVRAPRRAGGLLAPREIQ